MNNSKAFDKVWHEGLIFKLKSMGISDALLDLIGSVLENNFQRVVLNGQTSEWLPVFFVFSLNGSIAITRV